MNIYYSGSIGEIKIYHQIIIDTSNIFKLYVSQLPFILTKTMFLGGDETERAFSWLVTESIQRAFPFYKIENHFRHDLYKCVYDDFFIGEELNFRQKLKVFFNSYYNVKVVKVMCLLDRTYIAIGV